MLVSQIVLKEHKQVIEDIYKNIIDREGELFLIESNDTMESLLLNIIQKNGIQQSINEIQHDLVEEIKSHYSYQVKKWEWTIVYQLLLKLAFKLEYNAKFEEERQGYHDEKNDEKNDENRETIAEDNNEASESEIKKFIHSMTERFTYMPEIKNYFKILLERNEKMNIHYFSAKKSYTKFQIVLGKLKSKIKELSEFLGIDGVFILLAKVMDRSKFIDIIIKLIGTFVAAGLAVVASLITIFRWMQNPIEKTLKSLAKLLGIKPPDEEEI